MKLPYPAREGQAELIRAIETAQQGAHLIVEAGTGSGKTAAALAASLTTHAADQRPIVYLTRTNAQQRQVVLEHRALVESGQRPGFVVPLMGRRHYCPLMKDDAKFRDGTGEELGRLCGDAKRKATQAIETGRPVSGSCPYYEGLLRDGTGPVEALLAEGGLEPSELAQRVSACGSCPYEAMKALIPKASAVVAPYVFLVDGRMRETLLSWLGTDLPGIHVVVDEAHNLPDVALQHHSPRLTQETLARALKEAERYDDPVLASSLLTTGLLHALQKGIARLATEYIREGHDARIPPGALEERLMETLRVPTPVLQAAAKDLEIWGGVVREDQRSKGRLPRSYMGHVAQFLTMWSQTADAPYAHIIGNDESIEATLLEPSLVLGWLNDAASTTHMSGTLAPLAQHRAQCGLPEDTALELIRIRKGQLSIRGINGIHRRWSLHQQDPAHAEAQQNMARRILLASPGKTALFFPSHQMLADFMEEGFFADLGRPLFAERPGLTQQQLESLVDGFRITPRKDALLLAVLGGRISEGLDFPGDTLEHVVLFGIPYPPPSARLQARIDHIDRHHDGKGWTYAVHNPTGRCLRQAIGRMVRGPTDKGDAWVLDERVARFASHLEGLVMVDDPTTIPEPTRPDGFHLASALPGMQGGR